MARQGISSVFKKLFLMFLGLVFVVFAVLIVFFATYVRQQHEVEISGQINRVINSASVVEQQFNATFNVEMQLLNDARITQLAHGLYGDNYEKTKLILDVLSTIQSTQSINSIIDNIIIMFPEQGLELSAANGYRRKEYSIEEFRLAHSRENSILVINNNQLEMNVSSPLIVSLEENYIPDYEIHILLSESYLEAFLANFRNQKLEGAVWVLNSGTENEAVFCVDDPETDLLKRWSDEWQKAGSPDFYTVQTDCGAGRYLFVSQYIRGYNITLLTYQNTLAVAWDLDTELVYMSTIALLMGALFFLIVVWANRSVNKPLRKIMEAFERVRSGDMDVRIYHEKNDEFSYIYDSFNNMVSKIEALIENIKEQKALLENAELRQLQSQINPHFLYNSFYNIKFMAHREDYEQIETFVTALAGYYRFINKEVDLNVALSSEVAHMENYIEIQQMRFGDKIAVIKEDLPEAVKNFKVPKLILQPIIENAYNYGLKDKIADGLLNICYRLEGEFLYIAIEDNGGFLKPEKLEQLRQQINTFEGNAMNHAMTNIHRRLTLAYGGDCGLTLEIGEHGGMRVVIKVNTLVQL